MPTNDIDNNPLEEYGLQDEQATESENDETAGYGSDDQNQLLENAARLDEIETLLHELSSEFNPDTTGEEARSAGGSTEGLPASGDNDDTVKLPAATGFDLGKPVDYDPDPERYHHRRATEVRDDFSLTAQSMARRLAPSHAYPDKTPYDEMGPDSHDHMSSEEADPGPTLEPSRIPKRRMRLRPAKRVTGSRPEPRVQFNQSTPQDYQNPLWKPGYKAPGPSGRGLALGAALTVLVIGGATATVGFVKPLRSVLPDRLAQVFEQSPSGAAATEDASVEMAKIETAPTQPDTTRFDVATGPAAGLEESVTSQPAGQLATMASKSPAPAISAGKDTEWIAEEQTTSLAAVETSPSGLVSDTVGDGVTSNQVDKTVARLDQDSIVQATLKDPEKRALQPAKEKTVDQINSEPAADPTITGSVNKPAVEPAKPVAALKRSEPTGKLVETRTIRRRPATIAGVGNRVSVAGANAYAPASPDVQDSVPFPGTQARTVEEPTLPVSRQDDSVAESPDQAQPLNGIEALLARGHELLRNGQIASARLLFQRAASMGDERGAKGMGMTFDPAVYKTLPVAGVTPDQEKADLWYRKAIELARHKRIPDADSADARSVKKN